MTMVTKNSSNNNPFRNDQSYRENSINGIILCFQSLTTHSLSSSSSIVDECLLMALLHSPQLIFIDWDFEIVEQTLSEFPSWLLGSSAVEPDCEWNSSKLFSHRRRVWVENKAINFRIPSTTVAFISFKIATANKYTTPTDNILGIHRFSSSPVVRLWDNFSSRQLTNSLPRNCNLQRIILRVYVEMVLICVIQHFLWNKASLVPRVQ